MLRKEEIPNGSRFSRIISLGLMFALNSLTIPKLRRHGEIRIVIKKIDPQP